MEKAELRSRSLYGPQSASESGRVKSSRDVLDTILEEVRAQIEIECFSPRDRALAEQIAMIIAEIRLIPTDAFVRIDGSDVQAWIVMMVYERLTHLDIEEVISRFRAATYEIRRVKTYLRTALYNAVFEAEARIDNAVRAEIGEE